MKIREKEYCLACDQEDLVRLPCGTIGIISRWNIVAAGHVKEVMSIPSPIGSTGFISSSPEKPDFMMMKSTSWRSSVREKGLWH